MGSHFIARPKFSAAPRAAQAIIEAEKNLHAERRSPTRRGLQNEHHAPKPKQKSSIQFSERRASLGTNAQ
jgi:hypothetical protein